MEQIIWAFWPSKILELFARGIENNQILQNFRDGMRANLSI